jgi:hypothetical protein
MTRPSDYSFFDTDWGRYASSQVPHVPTPAGFTATGTAARVSHYQGHDEAKPIGIPGTTLNQGHPDDKIISIGGNFIVMGAAPGSETLRFQSKAGAAVEMSADGSMKFTSAKGLHIAASGDGHLLISGDFCVSATGDMKFKAGGMYFDTGNFIVHASGDMVNNITGSYNHNVSGDSHQTIQGDNSVITAGTYRSLTAGQTLLQSHERMKIATNKTFELSAKDKGFIETKGDMTILTEGTMKVGAHGDMQVKVKGNSTDEVTGNKTQSTKGNHEINVKGTTKVKGTGATTITTQGDLNQGAGQSYIVQCQAALNLSTAGDAIFEGAGVHVTASGTLHTNGSSQLYGTPWVAGASPGFPSAVSVDAPADPNTDIATTKTECPTDEEVLENTKQFSAKRTDYKSPNVNGGLGAIHAMAEDNGKLDDKLKKEVDRHYGQGEYDKYAKKQEEPLAHDAPSDTASIPQYYSNEHTGLA